MGTLISKKAQLMLLALGLVAAACGGDDSEAAPTPPTNLGGDSGVVVVPDAGVGGDGGLKDCFGGTPTQSQQFLNRCTSFGCQPFDNTARLPASYKPGQPLPTQL